MRLEDGPRLEDTYGRRLAYIFDSSGNSIDAQLIAAGFAKAWTRDGQHRDMFVGLEVSARSNEAGCLWATTALESTSTPVVIVTHPPATAVPSPTPVVVFWPAQIDFLRGWGGRQPWTELPRDVDSTFLAYRSLWVAETVIDSGQWSQEAFRSFVSGSTPDFPSRSRAAIDKLLEHPKDVVDSALWIYEPRTKSEATVGCGLAYNAARQRFGSFLNSLGGLSEYCTKDFGAWNTYRSYTYQDDDSSRRWVQENGDWIDYIASRLLGIE